MAKPKKNVIGEVYGRLIIIDDFISKTKDRRVLVKCSCGTVKDVYLRDLRIGDTQSCGCYLKEVITKHGDHAERLYKIYYGMLNRCYLKTFTRYDSYGGRGIRVCSEWKNSYENFRSWALSHGYTDDLSIDRIDVNGNYEPSNCRWILKSFQGRNKRKFQNTSSKYIGVSFCKQTGRWLAKIKIDGKQKTLGRRATELEAAQLRDQFIIDNGLLYYKLNEVL